MMFIDSYDTLVIMNSEYKSIVKIWNDDENFPLKIYY